MCNKELNFTILVPIYNESKTLYSMLKKLKDCNYNYLIVDDGSNDGTKTILHQSKTNFINYKYNRGKGYAIKVGAKLILESTNNDYILIIDGDGQMSFEDIKYFIMSAYSYPKAKIFIGDRLHNRSSIPLFRYYINKVMSFLLSKISGQRINDSQCGFRLIHKDIFKLKLNSNNFEFESEMLIKASKMGYKIKNVPIRCIYKPNRISKINPIKDTIRFIKLLFNLLKKGGNTCI